MKFEQLYSFFNHFLSFKLSFYFKFFINLINLFSLKFFFLWKISNYADGYWFLYSNKKSLHELRYLSNK